MSMLRVLSLGAGVQSTTLALMAAHGEIEPPDCAIFADTQSEPEGVYRHLARLKDLLPFPVHIITIGSLRADLLRVGRKRYTAIPTFFGDAKGNSGIGRRMCTREFKVDPLTKKTRELMGYTPRQRIPAGSCESWIGISTDEAHRMKPARNLWQINRYPLIERRMSRGDCVQWLERNGYQRPIKSACTFCPYHSDEEWRRMKADDPASFEDACLVDEGMRLNQTATLLRNAPYLHRSIKPLREVNFDTGMADLFGNECEGMCGV